MGQAAEDLRDSLLSHQLGLKRLTNSEQKQMLVILRRAERELTAKLRERLRVYEILRFDPGPDTTARTRLLLREIRQTLRDAYAEIGQKLPADLAELADYETNYTRAALQKAVPQGVRTAAGLEFVLPAVAQVRSAAIKTPFHGKTLQKHLASLEGIHYRRVRDVVQAGIVSGESVEAMVRKLREQAHVVGRRNLQTVVHAAVQNAAAQARKATMEANAQADIIKGYQWLSTLDLKTTLEWCVPRDGKQYDLDYQPIGHDLPWGAGPKLLHWNCRSDWTAIYPSWEELDVDAKEITGAMRASMDGEVAREITAEEWLRSRNIEELEQVFGKRRAQLFAQGELSVRDMVRARGGLIDLNNLAREEASAFLDAGVPIKGFPGAPSARRGLGLKPDGMTKGA